ncbi:NrdH-redoxin [Streptomyces sp. SID8382]|nr:NrdH-redoxin [Streptomyces sp. SID8382]
MPTSPPGPPGARTGTGTLGATPAVAEGGDPVTADRDGVVVYWRPMCPFCIRLRLRLRFTRLRYTEVNIWRDPEAAELVRLIADGNETVPTVTVAGRGMVNPSIGELMEAVRAHAPHALPKPR